MPTIQDYATKTPLELAMPAVVTPQTFTPTILSSKTAQTDLNKITAEAPKITSDIKAQQERVASETAAQQAKDAESKRIQAELDAKKEELRIKQAALAEAQKAEQPDLSKAGQPGYDVFGNKVANSGIEQARTGGGTYTGMDGKEYYKYDSSPVGVTTSSQTPTSLSEEAYNTAKSTMDSINGIQNGTVPLTEGENAMVNGLKAQFQELIRQQEQTNRQAEGTAQISGYRMGAGEYDTNFSKNMSSIVSTGLAKVADLNTKMASAVAELTQSIKNNKIANIKSAYEIYNSAVKERQATLQKVIDDTKKIKDEADKLFYDRVTKPKEEINLAVSSNFAPKEVRDAVANAKTVDEAIAAAGDYLHTATGDLANYMYYKSQTENNGGKPISYDEFLTRDANRKAKATAVANGYTTINEPVAGAGISQDGGSILSQTGLSIGAFNYLTQGTASMSRMSAEQRNAIMKEAEAWSKRTGQDISTFQSQYKAYNETLQKNIQRMNGTKIMENEIVGTLENLSEVADASELGKLSYANMAKIWAGQNVNDPIASKYAFHFQQLKNEMAGYFAASQGKNSPDVVDNNDAERAIKNGLNSKSLEGLKAAVEASTGKMAKVMQNSVDASRKSVWDLFGVGSKFKKGGQNSVEDDLVAAEDKAKSSVIDYSANNPKDDSIIDKMISDGVPFTQIQSWINQNR